MKDLISLNCPNCGGQLEASSTEMKIDCKYCGSQVLIKDFITERRVDKSDRIKSLKEMIVNATNNRNYTQAYNYCEEICKLDSSQENIALLNLCGVMSGSVKFSSNFLNDLYVFSPDEHRNYLTHILNTMNRKKEYEINEAKKIQNEQTRNIQIKSINKTYAGIFKQINTEINKMKKKTCKCGYSLEYNEDTCPECGLSYCEYQAELSREKQKKTKKMIKIGVIIGVPLIIIAIISSFVYNSFRINTIHIAIDNKNYAQAEQMIDEYQDSNSSRADVYELYADLYLAQDDPKKAIEKLEEGIDNVHSNDTADLQQKIDQIKKKYKLDK